MMDPTTNEQVKRSILGRLEPLGAAWKAQFEAPPSIPLKWDLEDSGLLTLDGIWICLARHLDEVGLFEGKAEVAPCSITLPLLDGFLDIIFTKDYGEYEISCLERAVRRSLTKTAAPNEHTEG